ncbi:MAG: ChaN family lipoprotein [Deltaproteobacteria bacterium]|nr:ChaN family lipoprotein [Deltaproteobacteria bacterium]
MMECLNARLTVLQKAVLAILCILFTGCASHKHHWQSPYQELSSLEEGDILHLRTGIKVTEPQLVSAIEGARIIYVSETHDNVYSHKVQMDILKALAERYPQKIAVAMEMLKRSSQEAADQWISGELDEKDFLKVWVHDWSDNFEYYRSILRYMRAHSIPLIAIRASDDWMEKIKNAESPDQIEEKLPDMDLEDPYHQAFVKAIFDDHPMGGMDFETFYKAQVLWDESMAQSIAEYLDSKDGRDKKILVLAGTHHIQYGFGIPRRVFRRLPLPYTIILPTTVRIPPEKRDRLMDITMPDIPFQPGDFAWIVSYEDLRQQKVHLGVIIQDSDEGVKLLGTLDNSTAQEAGLLKNDVLVALDGEPVETKFDLTYLISLKKPGEKGKIGVLRDGESLVFDVTYQAKDLLETAGSSTPP